MYKSFNKNYRMNKRLALISVFLLLAAPVFAAEGLTWAHFLFSGLEQPLVDLGIDPVPFLDLVIVAVFLIVFAYFAADLSDKLIYLNLQVKPIFLILQKL